MRALCESEDKAAEEHHDYLSEFCHPNSDAFANHFEWRSVIRRQTSGVDADVQGSCL